MLENIWKSSREIAGFFVENHGKMKSTITFVSRGLQREVE